jgi:hypothetical protein
MPAITTAELRGAAELARYDPPKGHVYPSAAGPLVWQHAQAIALVSIAESLEAIVQLLAEREA